MDLKGKRLLLLGGTGLMCSVVETAKQLGVYTIVTDYFPHSLAKEIADKRYDISTTDIESLAQLAREENIDGVFTGFSDINLYSARTLCDRLGLPFYATREQLELTTNKLKFKQLCRNYGVPTVKQYELDAACKREHLRNISYPVMLKPADSYASKGCSVCTNEGELIEAVKKALPFSASRQIVVEQYMNPQNCEDLVISYFFINGKAYLHFVGDRFTNSEQDGFAPLAAAIISPSKYLEEYLQELDKKVREMFCAIGIQNGRLFIQAFHDKNGFYFYEMGFRFSGGEEYIPLQAEYGIDELSMMIHHSITGKILEQKEIEPCMARFKSSYCNLVFLCSAGMIKRIEGLEEVRRNPSVLRLSQLLQVGDSVSADGTLGQVLCRVTIREDTQTMLKQTIAQIGRTIIAYDANEKPMMLHAYGMDIK